MKKNVASQLVSAQMTSATDGSEVTTGTCNVAVEIDGAAGTGGTATHIADGKWEYAPIQADTNGDYLTFQFVLSTAITQTVQIYTTFPQTGDTYALANGAAGFVAIDTVVDTINTNVSALNDVAATDIVSGGAITTSGGAVSNVTLVATTTTNTDMVTEPPTAAAIADAVLDEPLSGHTTDGTLGLSITPLDQGTATAGAAGSITLDTAMVYTADGQCQECYIDIIGGTGAGQSRAITTFTFATRVATVVPNWNTNPDATSKYRIRGFRDVKVKSIGSSTITAASIATDAIDANALAADAATEIATAVAANADITAIKTATDKLTFTVANQVDANVQYINDAAVVGDGNATPWDGA